MMRAGVGRVEGGRSTSLLYSHLEAARLTKNDVLVDLGGGYGTFVIAVCQLVGCRGRCVLPDCDGSGDGRTIKRNISQEMRCLIWIKLDFIVLHPTFLD